LNDIKFARDIEKIKQKKLNIDAAFLETFPDAIGLLDFLGCSLSASMSKISLIR
tara:strand:- start:285 stop:446 length:162 start_codon:yes stop_codon:yes gene_type:complete